MSVFKSGDSFGFLLSFGSHEALSFAYELSSEIRTVSGWLACNALITPVPAQPHTYLLTPTLGLEAGKYQFDVAIKISESLIHTDTCDFAVVPSITQAQADRFDLDDLPLPEVSSPAGALIVTALGTVFGTTQLQLSLSLAPIVLALTPGAEGKSAFEVWRSLGNKGSEQDFINSLSAESVGWTTTQW